MNKQFTPGPWKIRPESNNSETWDEIWNSDMSKRIADLDMVKDRKMQSGNGWFESEEKTEAIANVRLIASAPEMFELLERFCQQCNKQNIESLVPEYEQAMTLLDRITQH